MSLTLYQIADQYRAALAELDPALPEARAALDALAGSLASKATSIGAYVLELEAEAAALKAAAERLTERRRSAERRAAYLREYLREQMESCGLCEITSADHTVRLRLRACPPAVELDDSLPDLPAEYWRERVIREPDKARILEDLREGVIVPGARLVRRRRVEIA